MEPGCRLHAEAEADFPAAGEAAAAAVAADAAEARVR